MSIPTQQDIFLPLLNSVKDRVEHHVNEVADLLASHFKLSEEERRQQYPSGNDNIFRNRIRFARAFLARANLLEHPRRGYIKISQLGLEALKRKPSKIDAGFLNQLPGFSPSSLRKEKSWKWKSWHQNPSELLNMDIKSIRRGLAQDILETIRNVPPTFENSL